MKLCTKCGIKKTEDSFNKNRRRKDGLQTYCRDCTKIYNNQSYKDSDKRRKAIRQRNKTDRLRNKEFLRRFRRFSGCKTCGEKEPVVLDFHHLNFDEKDYNVSRMYNHSRKKD